MNYVAYLHPQKGWRVGCDYSRVGGDFRDICGAVNEQIARETATAMQAALFARS